MRTSLSLLGLFAASIALGQGFTHPPGVSPTITPAMLPAAAPGLGFPAPFGVGPGGYTGVPAPYLNYRPFSYGGYGYGGFGPYNYGGYGYGGYGYGLDYPGFRGAGFGVFPVPLTSTYVPLANTKLAIQDGPTTDSALTAQLVIEFPAEVVLRIDGKTDTSKSVKTDTGSTRTITTRALKPGETVTFNVSADWDQGSDRVSWERKVTLNRGETARLKVSRGFKKS